MHAEAKYGDTGSKFGKIAIVTALHLGVAIALMQMKPPPKSEPPVITDLTPLPTPVEPEKLPEPKPLPVEKLPDLPKPFVKEVPVTITEETRPPVVPPVPGDPVEIGPRVTGDGPGPQTGGGAKVVAEKAQVFTAALANAKDCVLPEYPKNALRNGDAGTVSLALLIGTNGQVTESKVQKSSGFRDLDRAAMAALSMCKFKPATNNGVAQPAWGQIAYVWRID